MLEAERLAALQTAATARQEVCELQEARRRLDLQSQLLEKMSKVCRQWTCISVNDSAGAAGRPSHLAPSKPALYLCSAAASAPWQYRALAFKDPQKCWPSGAA